MAKTIVIVGTLDSKGEENLYLKQRIETRGHRVIVIDAGVLGQPYFAPDISREEVAHAAGTTIKDVIDLRSGQKATKVMAEGAKKIVNGLYNKGQVDGLIALGVTIGTSIGLEVMSTIPLLRVPKLMLTSVGLVHLAGRDVKLPNQDVTFMQSVADLAGLSSLNKVVINNAAAAISGMAEMYEPEKPEKPMVSLGLMGPSVTRYHHYLKPALEERGYELIPFHVTGVGGRMQEQLVDRGLFVANLELTTNELIARVCGTLNDPGPDRLEAAGRRDIPCIVAPGALDFVSTKEELLWQFKGRMIKKHSELVTLIRTNADEMAKTGELIAQKLNLSKGPVAVIIPLRGFSALDSEGQPWYEPETDKAFTTELKRNLDPKVAVLEVDVHINDPQFSDEVIKLFDNMMTSKAG